jgi:hypothetical protein
MCPLINGFALDLGSAVSFDPKLEHRLKKFLKGMDITADAAVFRDRRGRLHGEITGDIRSCGGS